MDFPYFPVLSLSQTSPTNNLKNKLFLQVEDYLPSEWFSPATDGSSIDGKPITRKGLMAMKKYNMQVISF